MQQKIHVIADIDGVILDYIGMCIAELRAQFGFAPAPAAFRQYKLRYTLAKEYRHLTSALAEEQFEETLVNSVNNYAAGIGYEYLIEALARLDYFNGASEASTIQLVTARKDATGLLRQLKGVLPATLVARRGLLTNLIYATDTSQRLQLVKETAIRCWPEPVLYIDDAPKSFEAFSDASLRSIPINAGMLIPRQHYNIASLLQLPYAVLLGKQDKLLSSVSPSVAQEGRSADLRLDRNLVMAYRTDQPIYEAMLAIADFLSAVSTEASIFE